MASLDRHAGPVLTKIEYAVSGCIEGTDGEDVIRFEGRVREGRVLSCTEKPRSAGILTTIRSSTNYAIPLQRLKVDIRPSNRLR